MTNDEYLKELMLRGDGSLQAWFDAEHVDAQRDANRTCPDGDGTASNDSREKLEADITSIIRNAAIWARQKIERGEGSLFMLDKYDPMIRELLDRQAEITRKTEQAAWIQQANGLIHEANARADELQAKVDELSELNGSAWQDGFEKGCESRDDAIADWRAETDELRDELAKRDKGIARLKRQRDTARAKIDELHAECDTCCYKTDYIEMDFLDVDRLTQERDKAREMFCRLRDEITDERNEHEDAIEKLIAHCDELQDKVDRFEAERDALARDLADCERQRERLRQALGCAIDHAHEIMALVDIEGEVA